MTIPKIIIKSPSQCSQKELADFELLVRTSAQVATEGLSSRIESSLLLGFLYVQNDLVSIAGIKTRKQSYIESILLKAKAHIDRPCPAYELGYCYTAKEHRGKDYNSDLCDALLDEIRDLQIYATTANPSMKRYFTSRGFQQIGKSYEGRFSKEIKFFIKTPK